MIEPILDTRTPLSEKPPLTAQQELCYGFGLMEEAISYLRDRGVAAVVALHIYDPLSHRELVDVRLLGSRMACAGMIAALDKGVVIPGEFTSNLHPDTPSPDIETPFDMIEDVLDDDLGGDEECEIY